MKVLTLVGVKIDDKDWQRSRRPLARIYFTHWPFGFRRLVVKPVSEELRPFAKEVRSRITERMKEDPRRAFVHTHNDVPHGRTVTKASDSSQNLLLAIQHDLFLWGAPRGLNIVGYYVLSYYSTIDSR